MYECACQTWDDRKSIPNFLLFTPDILIPLAIPSHCNSSLRAKKKGGQIKLEKVVYTFVWTRRFPLSISKDVYALSERTLFPLFFIFSELTLGLKLT